MILWLIDPIEKLPLVRDSSLFLAYLHNKMGYKNFFTHELRLNKNKVECDAFQMAISLDENVFESISVKNKTPARTFDITRFKTLFFRLEPPVDEKYGLQAQLAMFHPNVLNSPIALQVYSEKFLPLYFKKGIPTYTHLEAAPSDGVLKPLYSFGGKGVEKVQKNQALKKEALFQPFLPEIMNGERRYFTVGTEVFGEVLKIPHKDDFRCSTVFGASKIRRKIDPKFYKICKDLAKKLTKIGIQLSVIDFIGKDIVEINITCPGFWNYWYTQANDKERLSLQKAFKKINPK